MKKLKMMAGSGLMTVSAILGSADTFAAQSGHEYVPVANGVPDFVLEKIDLKNNRFEFSFNTANMGERTVKSLGIYSYAYDDDYDILEMIDRSDGVSWANRVYYANVNYPGIWPMPEGTEENGRLHYAVQLSIPLEGNVLKADLFSTIRFSDETYWGGRISYRDCLTEWEARGKVDVGCQAVEYDATKELYNVRYELYGLAPEETPDDEKQNGEGPTEDEPGDETPAEETPPSDATLPSDVTPPSDVIPPSGERPAEEKPVDVTPPAEIPSMNLPVEEAVSGVTATNTNTPRNENENNNAVAVVAAGSETAATETTTELEPVTIDEDETVAVPELGASVVYRDLQSPWWIWVLIGVGIGAILTGFLYSMWFKKKRSVCR